ncbi:MAG TPA: type IV toxin-antitoxin system AbiEi family antitoxin domain-containing protein [Solirubrobacteraceae bacterium]|nr:type IV toxin-antitoxin system AbiEi family antitoxin domain-containing protein [Solirubrobacteraceae bacterium]
MERGRSAAGRGDDPAVCSIDPHIRRQVSTPTLAAEQHGMVARRQLLDAGVGRNTIDRWVTAGRLIRVHRGVYAVGHVPPSPQARAMAAVLACGPDAVLSHRSAAALWGLLRHHAPIDVTAPTHHRRSGIAVHRSQLAGDDVTRHYGIPTTTPARTLADLAEVLDPASLTRAVNDARVRRLTSLDALAAQLRPGRTTTVLASLIERPTTPTRSVFEDAFLVFCDRHGLPRPEVNATVAGYEVDMLWRPQRLIAELDGRAFHDDFERDRDKDADLLTAGHRVVRVTWRRLTRDERREAARFRRLLSSTR